VQTGILQNQTKVSKSQARVIRFLGEKLCSLCRTLLCSLHRFVGAVILYHLTKHNNALSCL